jgi:hypothetical protein
LEFKSSAGVFAGGIVTSIVGYVMGGVFAASAAAASSSYYSDSSAGFFAFLAFVGFLTALIGTIFVIKGVYRAMVKIDALAVSTATKAAPAPVQASTQS